MILCFTLGLREPLLENGEQGQAHAWFVSCECSGPWTLVGLVVIL